MHDDPRPEPYHNNPDSPLIFFNSCVSCALSNVLNPGDYCNKCAVEWRLPTASFEYIIVTPVTMENALLQSSFPKKFMQLRMDHAFENNQNYIVYRDSQGWDHITISERFHIPTVMKFLFDEIMKEE